MLQEHQGRGEVISFMLFYIFYEIPDLKANPTTHGGFVVEEPKGQELN